MLKIQANEIYHLILVATQRSIMSKPSGTYLCFQLPVRTSQPEVLAKTKETLLPSSLSTFSSI